MATLAVREVKARTGLHRDTILRYIREGKIQATLQPTSGGFEEYRVDEKELVKLPKPYKKRGDTSPMTSVHNKGNESLSLIVEKATEQGFKRGAMWAVSALAGDLQNAIAKFASAARVGSEHPTMPLVQ